MSEHPSIAPASGEEHQPQYRQRARLRPREPGSGSWLEEVTVEHGPPDLLGSFFLRADREMRERGVTLSFASFEQLVEVNAANTATWHPLIPLFNPENGPLPADRAFCLLGRNAAGEVIATQAARLYEWPETSFYYEAESLRLFYADPARSKQPEERCVVTAPSARFVSGKVVFSGGGWYRRDYRKQGLATLLPRISRALAFTRWDSDYTISIMAEKVIAGGMAERCGYTNVDWDLTLSDSPVGNVRCAFVWMERQQLLGDLRDSLSRFGATAQVDPRVDERRA